MDDQNNSLQKEIDELLEICERMGGIEISNSQFEPPATEEEISSWELTNGITIPESYKEWLRFSNGSRVFGNTAQFYSIEGMILNEKYVPEDLVNIGHLIGDGELLCFSKTSGKFATIFEGKRKDFNNFRDILSRVIRMGKSEIGEDEISNEVTAKLLALLEEVKRGERLDR